MPKTHLPSWKKYLKSPKRRFQEHKQHARARGVDFTLTFEQWWDIWDKSGHWKDRGQGKGKYCMHRIADRGGYSEGNVYIGRQEANSYACAITKWHGKAHPDALAEANGKIFNGEPGPDVPF